MTGRGFCKPKIILQSSFIYTYQILCRGTGWRPEVETIQFPKQMKYLLMRGTVLLHAFSARLRTQIGEVRCANITDLGDERDAVGLEHGLGKMVENL